MPKSLDRIKILNMCLNIEAARQILENYHTPMTGRDGDAIEQLRRALTVNECSYPYRNWLSDLGGAPIEIPEVVGSWSGRIKGEHLYLRGVATIPCRYAFLFVNDVLVKIVGVQSRTLDGLSYGTVRLRLNKGVLKQLPKNLILSLGGSSGIFLSRRGKLEMSLKNTFGKDGNFSGFDSNIVVNKKGGIGITKTEDIGWQGKNLRRYKEFSQYFESRFGYKLFIIYGTLLGYQRNGDFIPHDDDFDSAYFSVFKNPEDVREEMKSIIAQLLRDGYEVKINRLGGIFKPILNGGMFDVFPSWHDGEHLWMNNTTRLDCAADIFEPARKAVFKGYDVYIPNRPVDFLRGKYGENWLVPDSGYQPRAAPGVPEHLRRSRFEVAEFEEFAARVNATGPGRVVWPRRLPKPEAAAAAS